MAQVPVDSNSVRIIAPRDSLQKDRQEKDIVDVFRQLFHLKSHDKADAIRPGDRPVISALPAVGYTLQTRLAALVTGNIAFYTRGTPEARLSVVNAMANYTQNRQFTVPVFLNIWLGGNQYNLVGDWRYMKYPQSSFGLGSNSRVDEENPMDYRYIRIYQYLLKRIGPSLSIGIGYNLDNHWKISEQGISSGQTSDYIMYGSASSTRSAGPSLIAQLDTRDNPIRATKGGLISFVTRFNLKALGSDNNWQSTTLDLRQYIPFPRKSRNVLALWSYDWIVINGRPPFLDLPSNGWDSFNNTGRGYIQGRFRGTKMAYLETEYRMVLSRNGLLGAVFFANAETFSGAPGTQMEKLRPAGGVGLRIKLNKKSNTNICIDYGFGAEGMKGLFVNVGEVF